VVTASGLSLLRPLRRGRSALLHALRRIASVWRVGLARLGNDRIALPWSTRMGRGVAIHVTDGGTLAIGAGVEIGAGSMLVVQAGTLRIGNGVSIAHGCTLVAREAIAIGDDVLVAEYVSIRDQDHRTDAPVVMCNAGFATAPIEIGAGAWIGAKASVLRGSRIGAHAVVGAHALVRGEIPADSVAAGVPARVIRTKRADVGR
jgi:acetyltransferase-like isoleucine patch superfamily enzyme